MTTYIFVLLGIIIFLLLAILMRRPVVDISALREDNARLREKLAERLGALSQNAIELKNISGDIANFKNILMESGNEEAATKKALCEYIDKNYYLLLCRAYEKRLNHKNRIIKNFVFALERNYKHGDLYDILKKKWLYTYQSLAGYFDFTGRFHV